MQKPPESSIPEVSSTPGNLKFPFFDLPETEVSYDLLLHHRKISTTKDDINGDLFTPPSTTRRRMHYSLEYSEAASTASPLMGSEWASEISPIAKNRESDCSEVDVVVGVSSTRTPLKTPERNEQDDEDGDDIDNMLSELKSIIHQSQKKRKTRNRHSSLGASSLQSDNYYLIDQLTSIQPQDTDTIRSPLTELKASPPSNSLSEIYEEEKEKSLQHVCDDLNDARKEVDESSKKFVERIRDAAQKRKMAMTQSRDDLKAKEREQIEANETARYNLSLETDKSSRIKSKSERACDESLQSTSSNKTFKARPLPATTGIKGMGGLAGVPKVTKRPTTTPFSPLLGSRRHEINKIKSLEKPKMQKKPETRPLDKKKKVQVEMEEPKSASLPAFKARSVPPFIGQEGQGGLTGVPKVRKRSVTVPKSPMLGLRRKPNALKEINDHKQGSIPKAKGSPMTAMQTPVLKGLNFLEATSNPSKDFALENDENRIPSRKVQFSAYQPHSTLRAIKRADYDVRRDDNMKEKIEFDMKNRYVEIMRRKKELQALGKNLI